MMDAGIEIQLNLSSFDPTKNSIRFDILQGRIRKLLDIKIKTSEVSKTSEV